MMNIEQQMLDLDIKEKNNDNSSINIIVASIYKK